MNYQNNQFGKTMGKFSISIKSPLDIQTDLKIARVQNCPEITILNSTQNQDRRKKCVYRDDKISPQKFVKHENVMHLATK